MKLNYDFRNLTSDDIKAWSSASHEEKFSLCSRIAQDEDLRKDKVALMNIVSIDGVEPWILDYVGREACSDMEFLSVLINSTDEKRFSFEEFFNLKADGSVEFKYSHVVSPEIRSNPLFWDMLSARAFLISQKIGNRAYYDCYKPNKAREITIASMEISTGEDENSKTY